MERLGQSDAFAQLVIQLLQEAGWKLQPSRPAIGDVSLWMATRQLADGTELVVQQLGERFVDIGADLLTDAVRALEVARRPIVLPDVQLQLPVDV